MKPSHRMPRKLRLLVEELEPRQLLSGFQPTAAEQLMLEQLNDIRANPQAYGASIGVDLSGVAPAQPLAFDTRLIEAARLHAQDMNTRGYFDHNTPEGITPSMRLTEAGFPWLAWGESSAAGTAYPTSAGALAALITDAGVPDLSHRIHLLAMTSLFQPQSQVGIGIVQGGTGPLVNYYTIDTASTTDGRPFLTGAVFVDQTGSGKYAIGEGLGNVVITVTGANGTVTTPTFDSGGYSLQLNPGTYTVTASGGGLTAPLTQTVTLGIVNVRLNFVVPGAAVQAANGAWVGLLYRDLLGRVPAPVEVNAWSQMLAGGASRAAVVDGFLGSAEYAQHLVTQWFVQFLHRNPDRTGLTGFAAALQSGMTEDGVRQAIFGSTEYFLGHGATAAAFVQSLYQDLLGRAPAGHEADAWISLAASSRTQVAAGILGSLEFKTDEVRGLYAAFLRRQADAGGLAAFAGLLTQGIDEPVVVHDILTSGEYHQNAAPILWIQGLYQAVLGRSANSLTEVGPWLMAFDTGTPRSAIAQAFAGSTEAEIRSIDSVYQQLLGRRPSATELNISLGLLQPGGHIRDVIDQVVSSAEYYSRQGTTNTQFIRGLYHDLLNRGASDTEVLIWLNKFNSGETQSQVAADFTSAPEYQQDFITNLFTLYLHRSPTTTELGQYVTQLQSGASDAVLAGTLLASDEYYLSFSS
jgi:hypothetical protein